VATLVDVLFFAPIFEFLGLAKKTRKISGPRFPRQFQKVKKTSGCSLLQLKLALNLLECCGRQPKR
jgi:hypothetical protein